MVQCTACRAVPCQDLVCCACCAMLCCPAQVGVGIEGYFGESTPQASVVIKGRCERQRGCARQFAGGTTVPLGRSNSQKQWRPCLPSPDAPLCPLLPKWLSANGGSWPICFGQDWAEISRLPHIGYSSAHMYQSMR